MRLAVPTYPVDRYLVDSSKKNETVNIIDNDLWNAEPALKPEDEIILRKLHDMLQSTANDLRELSGELSQYHNKDVHVSRTLPMPLDEDFNNKVHIEEIVNAKFHGQNIDNLKEINRPPSKINKIIDKTVIKNNVKRPVINHAVQVNTVPILKQKKLSQSRTRTFEIDASKNLNKESKKIEIPKVTETVSYNEFSYKYDPKPSDVPRQSLQVQQMPSINIRSELTEHKVLHLDIIPETKTKLENTETNNVAVIEIHHEIEEHKTPQSIASNIKTKYHQHVHDKIKPTVKKIAISSTCESSESSNNVSSDHQRRSKIKEQIKSSIKTSPKTAARHTPKTKKDSDTKRIHFNLDEWKKKINSAYGQPSSSRKNKNPFQTNSNGKKPSPKVKSKVSKVSSNDKPKPLNNVLNNATYIPYSQLTLGGVRVSDIEREISDNAIKDDIPLSPILDKILTSRDNSFYIDSTRKSKRKGSDILNTSDEKLLQEVLEIENNINRTCSKYKTDKKIIIPPVELPKDKSDTSENSKDDSYDDDDFEEVQKSENSSGNQEEPKNASNNENEESESHLVDYGDDNENESGSEINMPDATFIKTSNLSIKTSVDIFEFIHAIETQDNATQSHTSQIISLKETQTSPRNDNSNIQPIHNDLCLSIDPTGEVEKLFKLEKDLIKKLIAEEYGDILEKNLRKPSTSKNGNETEEKNINASQKNTQTSPNRVKSVMTSPTRTKTRTTSPFTLNLTIDHQTSPLIFLNDKELKLDETETEKSDADDLGITINLSSPRFSLRLPQTSREVISNLENASHRSGTPKKITNKNKHEVSVSKTTSSSTDQDISSSEISSLGEVKLFKLKRRLRRYKVDSVSEFSSSSAVSESSSDVNIYSSLPLKSEGELTTNQSNKRKDKKTKTDDEKSLGQLF